MKRAFTIALIGFWSFTGILLVAAMVMFGITQPDKNLSKVSSDTNSADNLNDLGGAIEGPDGVNYRTELRTVEKQQYMSAKIVAEHNRELDCWLIIHEKVYEVTEYIPFHPGGSDTIIDSCGTNATAGYDDKDGNGTPHSAAADAQLKSYLIASIGDPWGTVTVTEEVRVAVDDTTGAVVEEVTGAEVSLEGTLATERKRYEANSPDGSIKFGIGSRVTALANQNGRKKPTVDSEKIRSISTGTTGEVLAGPLPADGYWWYLIQYNDGENAWSVQDYFAKAGSAEALAVTSKPKNTSTSNSGTSNTTNSDISDRPRDDQEVCTEFDYSPWGQCLSDGTQSRSVNYGLPRGCSGGAPVTARLCDYTAPANTCTDFTYSNWEDCQSNGTQSRNVESSSPSGCTGGSPDTERACTYEPPDVECKNFNYSSWGDCQSNNTQSRSVTSASPSGCTGGSPDTSRSCTYTPPVVTCTDFTYSSWGACQSNNTQTRTVIGSSPSGCTGGSPQTTRSCTYTPPTCESFTYSSWGDCQSNNTQTRSITSSSPSGCTGGSPQTTQSCTYAPPNNGISASEVATHNSANNCWLIINNKVYDVTDYIPYHPGGERTITNVCGQEATSIFNGNSGGHRHSGNANSQLNNYYVDDLQ